MGLTYPQFKVLYNFLNDVCPLDTINFWNKRESVKSEKAKTGRNAEFSTWEKLFICLVRLKRGFTIKTLAALLSSPDRKIEETQVRKKIYNLHSAHVQNFQRDANCDVP